MGVQRISEDDFVNVMNLKSDLICATDGQLMDYYRDASAAEYAILIHGIDVMLDIEKGVFAILTDEITNKIYKLINLKRFEIKDTYPEIFDLINDVVTKLNNLSSLSTPQKAQLRRSYLVYQQRLRNLTYLNYESFIESLGIDAILYDYFNDEDTLEGVPYSYIIGSMYSLKTSMPMLFKNESVLDKAGELLTEMENSGQRGLSKRKIDKIRKKVLER